MFLPLLLPLLPTLYALDNGLALTPPMGWMTWQRFRCLTDCTEFPQECISEKLIEEMAWLIVHEGYLAAGYEYIVVDDCWMAKERDENGRLIPDPERFPSGIKALVNYVHRLGLKFGIYGNFGRHTCIRINRILGQLKTDAQTFADWGVDYVKMDGYYKNRSSMAAAYVEFGKLLNRTGRPIVYSCVWPAYEECINYWTDYELLVETCNLWRNWCNIEDTWSNVTNILKWFSKHQYRIGKYSGPGHWIDPDMLLVGNYGLSDEQSKSQMAIWSIMSAPLLMSVDLRAITVEQKQILLNPDAIAINQDSFGIMGKLVYTIEKIDVWTKPMAPIVSGKHSLAIAFISNRIDGYPYLLEIPLQTLGLGSSNGYHIKNVFEPTYNNVLSATHIFVRVKPSGTVFLKLTPRD